MTVTLKPAFLLAATLGFAGFTADAGQSATQACRTGQVCPDGSVLAGRTPGTGQPLYTTRDDAPRLLPWDLDGSQAAAGYCAALTQDGHDDWHLPGRAELSILYANRASIGTFDTSSGIAYWSASERTSLFAWSQDFSDGFANGAAKSLKFHVRCVRQPGGA